MQLYNQFATLLSKVTSHHHINGHQSESRHPSSVMMPLVSRHFAEEESHIYCSSTIDLRLLFSKVTCHRHINGHQSKSWHPSSVAIPSVIHHFGEEESHIYCRAAIDFATPLLQSDLPRSHQWWPFQMPASIIRRLKQSIARLNLTCRATQAINGASKFNP